MRADQIIKLLAERHSEDVFFPECKNGPSQCTSHLRLDAWAMKKSWANPISYGYEVKVSRSDFMGDEKWRMYLPYCSEFYFVAAPGIIQPNELPAEAGLIEASSNAKRLLTKKKSARRASR